MAKVKVIDRRGVYEDRLYETGETLEMDSARAMILQRQRIVDVLPEKEKTAKGKGKSEKAGDS